ncbi:MAG: hypothetical protein JXA06_02555 [Bacteroidetes bacterium]|nr:hypothetical protein [Bacteroidota bacterium]
MKNRNSGINKKNILILLVSFISFSCIESPLEPVGPTYDTHLTIPILDKTEYFSEFAKKDTVFLLNTADSTYFYNTSFTTEPVQVDSMTYEPDATDTTAALGVFDIEPFVLPAKNIAAPAFGVPTGNLPGLGVGTYSAAPVDLIDTSEFYYVGVNTGILTMTVTNNFPFPISFPDPIILRNNWTSPEDTVRIAGYVVPGILSQGASISLQSPLDNELVRGILTTDAITIHTEGYSGPISIFPSDGISISFQSSPLKADSAFAVISYQMLQPITNGTFTLDDVTVIRQAFFKEGSFLISITNGSQINSQVHIRINELFYRSNGENYRVDRPIQGGETYVHPVSMPPLYIETPGTGTGTHLHYSVDVEIFDSEGVKKQVSKNDVMIAQLQPDRPLTAERVDGRFEPMAQDIDSGFESDYDLGKDIDKVRARLLFRNVQLNLRLYTRENIPFSYENLVLVAKNSKYNQTRSISIFNGTVDPAHQNSFINIAQNSSAAEYSNFVNFFGEFFPDLPDSFFVRGVFNAPADMNNFYTIYDTSKVYPSLDVSIPTDLAIISGSVVGVEKDPISDDVEQSVIRSIIDGAMNLEFTNRIPIAMKFQMSFLKWDSTRSLSDTTFRILPDTLIKASEVDMLGNATNPRISNMAIHLTGEEVNTMAESDSVCIRLFFNTGNGINPVKFRHNDFIRIRSSVNVRCTINKP